MSSRVFRKAALDRLSSPEQLDQLVRITLPQGWISLGILTMLVGFALVWGWFGSITQELTGDGTLRSTTSSVGMVPQAQDGPLEAILYLPVEQENRITSGMEARILPVGLQSQQYGFLIGKVRGARIGMKDQHSCLEVEVALQQNPGAFSGFQWSSSSGPHEELSSNMPVTGKIIVRQGRPLSLLIPALRNRDGV